MNCMRKYYSEVRITYTWNINLELYLQISPVVYCQRCKQTHITWVAGCNAIPKLKRELNKSTVCRQFSDTLHLSLCQSALVVYCFYASWNLTNKWTVKWATHRITSSTLRPSQQMHGQLTPGQWKHAMQTHGQLTPAQWKHAMQTHRNFVKPENLLEPPSILVRPNIKENVFNIS